MGAPSRSDANSNGHFPPANGHMPAGTPRGFNLQNFGIAGGMPPMPGFGQPGFSPFFPANMPAGNWNGSADNRGGGPIRRGGKGRLSPPPGSCRGGMTGGGRWGDGAAGGAAVGPREAVQGRSLKSYEDLDAVAGGGSGELNY